MKNLFTVQKAVIFLALLCITVLCFAACPKPNDTDDTTTTSSTTAEDSTSSEATSETETTEAETTVPVAQNVKPISPAVGESIRLQNDLINAWWQNYEHGVSNHDTMNGFSEGKDQYYPNPVTFSFETLEPADYYRLTISRKSDMSEGEQYILSDTSIVLDTLFTGTDYYWQVEAVYADKTVRSDVFTFNTVEGPRAIRIDGISNTRDIGGTKAGDGKRIKQGMIYRGAAIDEISDEGKYFMINALGIKTDMDIRSADAYSKSPLGDTVQYKAFRGPAYDEIFNKPDKGIDWGRDSIRDEIRLFADPANYPIYVHCSIGRDRTGTLITLIEGLLGVEPNDMSREYSLSVFSSKAYMNAEDLTHFGRCVYVDVENRYRALNTSGSIEKYVLSLGVTADEIAAIRSILLEEYTPAADTESASVTEQNGLVASSYNSASKDTGVSAPVLTASNTATTAKDEIPYGDPSEMTMAYSYGTFKMMNETEAAAAKVPAGYSGYVLALTPPNGRRDCGIVVKFENLHIAEIKSITFRIFCPSNTKVSNGIRTTCDPGPNNDQFIAMLPASATQQWIEVTLNESNTDFTKYADENGFIRPFNFGARFESYDSATFYIDSITVDKREPDTVAPVITYKGESTFHFGEGSAFIIEATAFDEYFNCEVEVKQVWSEGAMDDNGYLKKGEHTCTLQATDLKGNKSEIVLTVKVGEKDTEAPVIQFKSDAIHAKVGAFNYINITSTDNYEGVQTKMSWSEGTFDARGRFAVGAHKLTVVATDAFGNETTKTIAVIVSDNPSETENLISEAK